MTRLLLAAVLLAALASSAAAQTPDSLQTPVPVAQLSMGAPLPEDALALPAAAGGTASLADAARAGGLVVVFWSNTCPWGDRYAGRVAALASSFEPAGVGFVLVNANDPGRLETEGAAASLDELTAGGLSVPYLLDVDGALRRAFGVRNAPHAFLFGPDRTLLYDGAIDDSPSSAERVERPYLREALDKSVAGLPVEVQRTQAFGCLYRTP